MDYTRLLLIKFQNSILSDEIESFRGAIISHLKDKDILFHNHLPEGEGLRYSYPLIQYKRINRKAAILCIGVGTEAIGKLFADSEMELTLTDRKEKFMIDNVKAYQHRIQVWESKFGYRIRKWLALNQENYEKYNRIEGLGEKTFFLENILKGNILSFAKGLNIFMDKQVECKITRLSEPSITRYKGSKLSMFDAEFSTNVSIPDYVGLGKGVSLGYGTVIKALNKSKNDHITMNL
ncbi:MAG: CRISPR-associated endonuclease Cas6 [Bacteroidota bacterium]|jgi:hypothetical protein|nr:hypothetical protein C0T31_04770 [Dysgonamonadaceae bacterium]